MYKFILNSKATINALLVIFLLISYFAWNTTKNYYDLCSEDSFKINVIKITDNIERRMLVYENALRSGVAFYQSSQKLTREDWKQFVENLQIKNFYPGIQGLGITLMLKENEIKPLESLMQNESYPSFKLKPIGKRDQYSAIIYLEPLDKRNRAAIGYDMFSQATRRNAMEIARDSGLPKISSRVTLVQEIDSDVQAGVLMYLPLYEKSLPLNTIEDRRKALIGYVYSVFRMGDLMTPALAKESTILLELYDGEKSEKNLLFKSSNEFLNLGKLNMIKVLKVGGREWNVYAHSTQELDKQLETYIPMVLAILWIIISLNIYAVLITLYNGRKNLTQQVYQRTKELEASKQVAEEAVILKTNSLALLEQKNNELETIIQEAPNPIIIYSEDGKVHFVNKVWEQLSGYSYDEINTMDKWIKKAYGQITPSFKEVIRHVYPIHHKVDDGEYNITTKDGNTIIWQFSSASLGLVDGKRTVISSAMDVTELKQKDEMLINQSRHAAMGEMIGMIAHQWRQPLTAISMEANNILFDFEMESLSLSASREYANSISKITMELSKTIDDFSNFFKQDKAISKVNIKDVLNQTLSISKDSYKSNHIKIKITCEKDKEINVYPIELVQVFVNIINNSKDVLVYNKSENALISIKVYEDEKYINIEICDNGGGIDVDILPKVFDPYFSTKDEKNGTGLGLYMSKMIIENHLNGVIEVSNKDDGACFTVRLLK